MSTEALRGTSRHQFLGRRNELSAQLEMDRRKGQNGFGGCLRHQTRCDPSGSNLYRRSYRLGSVSHRAGRSRLRSSISGPSPEPDGAQTLLSEISWTLCGAFFNRRSRPPLLTLCMVRPRVARGFVNLADCGLASMYPASDWSVWCSGPSWISARMRAD
jgi:hypothetical protein